jgi:hypothetical protein
LTGYALRNVAERAENEFGKDSEGGLNAYTTAFAMMESKIKLAASDEYEQTLSGGTKETFSGWGSLQNADLLSADVYYNVDSTDCADLRGVGIKGTRYLGSITGQTYSGGEINRITVGGADIDNMSYIAAGTQIKMTNSSGTPYNTVVRPGMAGFTDVYGIYLTDNLEEDGEVRDTTKTPEYMFVIRNGMNGPQGEKGDPLLVDDSAVTETLVNKEEFTELKEEVSGYSEQIRQMNENLRRLTNYYNTISLDNVNNLMVMVSRLQQQMASMQEYIFNLNVTLEGAYDDGNEGGNEGGGGTSITAVPLGIVKDEDGKTVFNDYEPTEHVYENGIIDGWDEDDIKRINSKKFRLLGYLENDEKYLTSSDGYRNLITLDKLYILPNIGVSLTGATFGMENPMNAKIEGDVTMKNMSADNKIYASSGFYQSTHPENFGTVENIQLDDFKEPNINI